jgi:predicted DNA-binding transcriptional regulator AlpA
MTSAKRSARKRRRANGRLPAPSEIGEILTTKEAARFLGVSIAFLEIGRHKGNLGLPPFVKLGTRLVRYQKSALLTWLAARQQGNTGQKVPS